MHFKIETISALPTNISSTKLRLRADPEEWSACPPSTRPLRHSVYWLIVTRLAHLAIPLLYCLCIHQPKQDQSYCFCTRCLCPHYSQTVLCCVDLSSHTWQFHKLLSLSYCVLCGLWHVAHVCNGPWSFWHCYCNHHVCFCLNKIYAIVSPFFHHSCQDHIQCISLHVSIFPITYMETSRKLQVTSLL